MPPFVKGAARSAGGFWSALWQSHAVRFRQHNIKEDAMDIGLLFPFRNPPQCCTLCTIPVASSSSIT